ncbi:hypothetical protein GCM10027610_118430 [Dactylosporangium cerinum]
MLVLEIVGLRLVGPYVGVTLSSSTAIIGVALAAIAYGAWTGGWLADRRIDQRKLLSPLLLLGAVATAATLPIIRVAGEWLRGTDATSVLLLAAMTLFVPAALLSAVTPLVVKLQLADLAHTGRVVGRLSSLGTLGAITATFATGFVLVATVPTSVILLGLAAILAVAGFGFGGYWRRRGNVSAALAFVAVGVPIGIVAPNPCDVETAYTCAAVEPDGSGRTLFLNGAQHSYVDLDNPTHLEYAYTQWIGSYLDGLPAGPSRCCTSAAVGSRCRGTSPRPVPAATTSCWSSTRRWSPSTGEASACGPARCCGWRPATPARTCTASRPGPAT